MDCVWTVRGSLNLGPQAHAHAHKWCGFGRNPSATGRAARHAQGIAPTHHSLFHSPYPYKHNALAWSLALRPPHQRQEPDRVLFYYHCQVHSCGAPPGSFASAEPHGRPIHLLSFTVNQHAAGSSRHGAPILALWLSRSLWSSAALMHFLDILAELLPLPPAWRHTGRPLLLLSSISVVLKLAPRTVVVVIFRL